MSEHGPDHTADAPHLLYVAWGYPPSRSAGMYRALATANAFAREGWRVTVLTATRKTFEQLIGSDPNSEEAIDPRVEIVRIAFDPERGETDLARWSRLRVYSPLFWNALRWLRALISFPEIAYGSWRRPLERAAERIHRRAPIDLLVGTANPNVDFAAGAYLHRKFGVPYVMDHRDAWHLNVYTGKRVGSRISRSNRLERRLLRNCLEAWFVNDPIRDWHASEYPERARDYRVVSNGFDAEFLNTKRAKAVDPSHLVFGYLGTIYGPIPLREALEAWRLAREQSPLVANAELIFRGRLGHFAEPDPAAAALLREFEVDGVSYQGPVSKTQVAGVYGQFDAVLLIISKSKYVTSGKVFEYAATGLPIVALHDPSTAATSVLEGHPLTFAVTGVSIAAFAEAIIAAAERTERLTTTDIDAAKDWAQHLSREAQLVPRVRSLRTAVQGTRSW